MRFYIRKTEFNLTTASYLVGASSISPIFVHKTSRLLIYLTHLGDVYPQAGKYGTRTGS